MCPHCCWPSALLRQIGEVVEWAGGCSGKRETIAHKRFSSILFPSDILLGQCFPAFVFFFWIDKKGILSPKESITCFLSLVL